MPSLLNEALDLLGDKLETKSDEWLDKLIEKLDELIRSTEDEELRDGGLKALDILKDHKDKLSFLGKRAFLLFITHAAARRDDEAAKEYYRAKASAREIIDSILDDAFDIERVRREKEDIFNEAFGLVKTIASGARFLLPFLFAAI